MSTGHVDLVTLARRALWSAALPFVTLLIASGPAAAQTASATLLEKARYEERIRGDLENAIRIYRSIVDEHAADRSVAARALLELAEAYETLGRDGARDAYARIVADYADQVEVARVARSRLSKAEDTDTDRSDDREGFRMIQLWVAPHEVGVGSLSPDGRRAAFVDWGGVGDTMLRGHADVTLWDTQDGSARYVTDRPPLTELDVYPSHPTWSEDGRRLAYSLWADGWTHMQLRLVRPDGSGDRAILDNRQMRNVRAMDFSSDGAFVAAVMRGWDDVWRLGLVSTDGDELTILKTLGAHPPTTVSVSPDDRFVAYDLPVADDQDRHDLFVLAVDGSEEVRLAPHPAEDQGAFWTPGGQRVVFLSDRSGERSLWAIDWAGGPAGEPELVRANLQGMELVGLTASGSPYFRSPRIRSEVYVADIALEDEATLHDRRRLPQTGLLTNMRPAWAPDGGRVAWLSMRGPGGEAPHLVVKALDSGVEVAHPLPFPLGDFRQNRVDWARDGRHVWIEGGATEPGVKGRVSYRIDTETGAVAKEEYRRDFAGMVTGEITQFHFIDGRQAQGLRSLGVRLAGQTDGRLLQDGDLILRPGERLLFVRNGVEEVVDYGLGTGMAREERLRPLLPLSREYHVDWSLSPDGTALAVAGYEGSSDIRNALWVMPLDGGEPREILRLPAGARDVAGRDHFGGVRWTPDGERLIYALHTTGAHPDSAEIWMVDADGGEPRALGLDLTPYELGTLRFDPEGRRIVWARSDLGVELWLAEGLPWQVEGSGGR